MAERSLYEVVGSQTAYRVSECEMEAAARRKICFEGSLCLLAGTPHSCRQAGRLSLSAPLERSCDALPIAARYWPLRALSRLRSERGQLCVCTRSARTLRRTSRPSLRSRAVAHGRAVAAMRGDRHCPRGTVCPCWVWPVRDASGESPHLTLKTAASRCAHGCFAVCIRGESDHRIAAGHSSKDL